jgi:hypothetical protein
MIKSSKKKHEFRKKRLRNEKRIQKNKKQKRSKKTQKSIVQKSTALSSEIISDEFSLSIARIVITSDRTSSLTSQFDDRARQLSDELKKVHRQYQAERMTKLIQSRHQTIDKMLRYEYDLDTSKRSIQIIISFILINISTQEILFIISHHAIISNIIINAQAQKNTLIHVRQIILRTSSIIHSSVTASNIVFDLKNFLSSLKIIICERNEIEKNMFIEQMRTNSAFKRIILEFFNESTVIMRRVVNYDSQRSMINVKESQYKTYRETSLKEKNIIYRQK